MLKPNCIVCPAFDWCLFCVYKLLHVYCRESEEKIISSIYLLNFNFSVCFFKYNECFFYTTQHSFLVLLNNLLLKN